MLPRRFPSDDARRFFATSWWCSSTAADALCVGPVAGRIRVGCRRGSRLVWPVGGRRRSAASVPPFRAVVGSTGSWATTSQSASSFDGALAATAGARPSPARRGERDAGLALFDGVLADPDFGPKPTAVLLNASVESVLAFDVELVPTRCAELALVLSVELALVLGNGPALVLVVEQVLVPGGDPALVPDGEPSPVPGAELSLVPGAGPALVPGGEPVLVFGAPLSLDTGDPPVLDVLGRLPYARASGLGPCWIALSAARFSFVAALGTYAARFDPISGR